MVSDLSLRLEDKPNFRQVKKSLKVYDDKIDQLKTKQENQIEKLQNQITAITDDSINIEDKVDDVIMKLN